MPKQPKLSASDLVALLALKHAKDLFVRECKDGPTWTSNHLRLDAWVLKRSYAQPNIWGYEVKASRSDFLKDDKWPGYLPLCNEFSFVCPSGAIQPEELPEGVGLLWAAKTGTRLFTKRKAPHREIEPPINLFLYILMSRATIGGDRKTERGVNIEWWTRWLAGQTHAYELGGRVSEKLSKHIAGMEKRTVSAESDLKKTQAVQDLIQQTFGLNIHDFARSFNKEEMLAKAIACVPPGLVRDMRYQAKQLASTAGKLEQLAGGSKS